MPLDEEPKSVCWRPKQALIECIIRTKCYQEMGTVEDCMACAECYLERKNWVLCKVNVMNPRYRLRGNPYDIGTEDQKKIEARNERIAKRMAEEQGIDQMSQQQQQQFQIQQMQQYQKQQAELRATQQQKQ